jgi:hypothetical protein
LGAIRSLPADSFPTTNVMGCACWAAVFKVALAVARNEFKDTLGNAMAGLLRCNGIYGADFHALQLIYRVGADAEVLNGMV